MDSMWAPVREAHPGSGSKQHMSTSPIVDVDQEEQDQSRNGGAQDHMAFACQTNYSLFFERSASSHAQANSTSGTVHPPEVTEKVFRQLHQGDHFLNWSPQRVLVDKQVQDFNRA